MKAIISSRLAMAALVSFSASAQAAVSCGISSSGFFSVYDGLVAADNLNQSTFTITCSRVATDPSTFNYIAYTNDGSHNNGPHNRAKIATSNNYLDYDFYIDSAYSVNWSKSNKCIIGVVNFGTSLSGTQTKTYYAKIPKAQTAIPQGTYIDTVVTSVAYNQSACQTNATANLSTTFQVQISNIPSCQIALPPGTVAFTYTAFSATPATASTTFAARCSSTIPYTMALDANVGVVSGLNYGLTLSARSATGNGALQNYSINGTMAAGQAGSCASANCTATDRRTLTVTY